MNATIPVATIDAFVQSLEQKCLLDTPAVREKLATLESHKLPDRNRNPLYWKLLSINPEKIFDWLLPRTRWAFTPWFHVFGALSILTGFTISWFYWEEFSGGVQSLPVDRAQRVAGDLRGRVIEQAGTGGRVRLDLLAPGAGDDADGERGGKGRNGDASCRKAPSSRLRRSCETAFTCSSTRAKEESSTARGATMPKPSVALCNPKPMMSTSARLTSFLAAD